MSGGLNRTTACILPDDAETLKAFFLQFCGFVPIQD